MNTTEKRKRRRYSAEEKAALLARYRESGQTQMAFCREAGLAVPTLSAWRVQAARMPERRVAGALVDVTLPPVADVVLEVNGCTLRVDVGTSPAWLAALVHRLRPC